MEELNLKQRNKCDCGPAALRVLFMLCGYGMISLGKLVEWCGSTEADGTSHEGMLDAVSNVTGPIELKNQDAVEKLRNFIPFVVNYYKEDDGHYGVVVHISSGDEFVVLFDPEDGCCHILSTSDFNTKWYSERYGEHWGLAIPIR